MMRIGIDASCWLNRRGFGRYTRELVGALLDIDRASEYVLFLDDATARRAENLPAPDRVVRVVVPTDAAAAESASAKGSRSIADLWRMRRAVAAWGKKLDVFLFPADYTYFPIRTPAKVIVTKHDMTDQRVPELLFPTWRSRLFWEVKIRLAMRRADLVFTVSENSRRDIVRAFRLPDHQVRVVSDAVDPMFTPATNAADVKAALERYGLAGGERFVLYVGGISPHKNLDTLVLAFERWQRTTSASGRDVRLVLVGDYTGDVFHSSYANIRRLIASKSLEQAVRFTGYVPDADLRYFYSAAEVVVMPSFYEGFGLPALEAMASGTPVIVSNAGALPEVVGDAGLLFDPHSCEDLADALERVLTDVTLRRTMSERGKLRASRFTWEASARTALSAFAEIAG